MKNKIALTTIFMFVFLMSIQAQKKVANLRTLPIDKPKIAAELNLTDEQKKELKQQTTNFRIQEKKIEQDSSLNEEKKKQELKLLKKQRRKEVELMLTTEQKAKLTELSKKNKLN